MRKSLFALATATIIVLAACTDKKATAANNEAVAPTTDATAEAQPSSEPQTETATLDGVSHLIGWSMGLMNVSKNADGFIIKPNDSENELVWKLKAEGNGTYQETSGKKDMLGQSAKFKVQKVGDVTTLSAYDGDRLLCSFVSGDDLKAYRDRCYKRMLTSNFEPVDGEPVEITEDEMKVFLLPEAPTMHYFFIEDGNGDLTDKIRLSAGRFFLAFAAADKGVNLHSCTLNLDTDELEVSYDEVTIMRYAKDPGWAWLSTDVLDSDFIYYNFDKPYWQVMLSKLKNKQQPTAIEQWNRATIENLVANADPFGALESTDQ